MYDLASVIRRGNVIRKSGDSHIAMYLGSGDFGGCFDEFGRQPRGFRSETSKYGETCFMHKDVYYRGYCGLDYYINVGHITYDLSEQASSEQKLDLWDGCLSTTVMDGTVPFCVKAGFNPYARDIFGMRFSATTKEAIPQILYRCDSKMHLHYGQIIETFFDRLTINNDAVEVRYCAENTEGYLLFRVTGGRVVKPAECPCDEIVIEPIENEVGLLLAVCSKERYEEVHNELMSFVDIIDFFAAATEGWHKRWTADIPDMKDEPWNKLFLRSVFHILCSWSPSCDVVSPPCGWTGNNWPFEFPQDVAFINHAVLALGLSELSKARVEFYASIMDEMHELTQRVYGADGIMWAWICPIGKESRILVNEEPNYCHYEIHNAVYPAQMAYQTARKLGDDQWAVRTAWPVVRESARFYASVVYKDGKTYSIRVTPSMGQDEFGGINAKNYLCSLYAARYTLTYALRMADEYDITLEKCERQKWLDIVDCGLGFDKLENNEFGVYQTCEGTNFQLGNMKHPIELLPWSTLYWEGEKNSFEVNAYENRFKLCKDSDRNFYHGWTLAKILCAEALNGDEAAFRKTFDKFRSSNYTDADFTQIYETSGATSASYYVTSEGLFVWAVLTMYEHMKGEKS